jgi:hypothetical protein
MVRESEIKYEPGSVYLIHEFGKIISGVHYHTTRGGTTLAERVLIDEFGLVNERDGAATDFRDGCRKLVYERAQELDSGIAHFHLNIRRPGNEMIYLHHWIDRLTPDDFKRDVTREMLKRIYEVIQPNKVTNCVLAPLKEKLPWQK